MVPLEDRRRYAPRLVVLGSSSGSHPVNGLRSAVITRRQMLSLMQLGAERQPMALG